MDSLGIVINNKARNSSSFSSYLDALSNANLQYKVYVSEPEKLEATIKKCIQNHPILLIGGGDGTIRSAAQYCANTSTLLGVLPLGTLNHFAKELHLPFNPEELVQAIIKQRTITVDLGEVNGLIFINNSSIGFYPSFTKKRNNYMKLYNKWISYIPSMFKTLQSHETFSMRIKNKKIDLSVSTSFLMISNNLYSYKFPLTVERKHFNKAQLGIYFFKHGKLVLSKIFRYFFNRKNSFEFKKSSQPIEVHVTNKEKMTISLDGESRITEMPLRYKILPKSLTLLTVKS